MDTLIISLLFIFACIGLFIQHKKIQELKNTVVVPPIPNMNIKEDPFSENKRGVIEQGWERFDKNETDPKKKIRSTIIFEVEEIERLGNQSRIKILKISGGLDQKQRDMAEDQMPEIVQTDIITFFNEPQTDTDGQA